MTDTERMADKKKHEGLFKGCMLSGGVGCEIRSVQGFMVAQRLSGEVGMHSFPEKDKKSGLFLEISHGSTTQKNCVDVK